MMFQLKELIYPYDSDLFEDKRDWWVAHLKVHQEFKIAEELKVDNVPYFLPLVEKLNRHNSRRRTKLAPLFPGYFFFSGNNTERLSVLRTGRTARVIKVLDQEKIRNELKQIWLAVRAGVKVDPFEGLKEGKMCRVVSGSAMGLEGKIIRKSKNCKIAIEVTSVGQGIIVEVDANNIQLLEENGAADKRDLSVCC